MTTRNLSPQRMFNDLVKEHKPECRFSGKDRKYFLSWKKKTLPKVLATLGEAPPSVEAKPEMLAEWEDKDLIRQRWIINVQKYLSAILLANIPKGFEENRKTTRYAVLSWPRSVW